VRRDDHLASDRVPPLLVNSLLADLPKATRSQNSNDLPRRKKGENARSPERHFHDLCACRKIYLRWFKPERQSFFRIAHGFVLAIAGRGATR
jgi:hypothetical protein